MSAPQAARDVKYSRQFAVSRNARQDCDGHWFIWSWAARGVPTDKSTAEICTGTATLTGISGSIETRQDMPGFTLTSHPHSRPSVQQILLSSHVVHAKAEHSWLDCVMGFLVLMTLGSQWLKRFSHQLWQILDVASAFKLLDVSQIHWQCTTWAASHFSGMPSPWQWSWNALETNLEPLGTRRMVSYHFEHVW